MHIRSNRKITRFFDHLHLTPATRGALEEAAAIIAARGFKRAFASMAGLLCLAGAAGPAFLALLTPVRGA